MNRSSSADRTSSTLLHSSWQRALRRGALRARDGGRRRRRRQVAARRGAARFGRRLDRSRGRCLSYGEGITYWPVVEVLKQLGGASVRPGRGRSLRSLLGETESGTSTPTRSPGPSASCSRSKAPIVCVFDDIQWGEETFLDLIEHVALLLERADPPALPRASRTSSSAGRMAASRSGSSRFATRRRRADTCVVTRRAAIPDRSRGRRQPALPDRDGSDAPRARARTFSSRRTCRRCWPHASISSRSRSAPCSSAAPSRARSSTAARCRRCPRTEPVVPRLAALVRKELIRPDRTQLPGDDAFRFRHLLIRDAAYEGLSKAVRAELHERFADWLEERGADLVELDEILGFHLEQAARYSGELGQTDRALGRARRRPLGGRWSARAGAR